MAKKKVKEKKQDTSSEPDFIKKRLEQYKKLEEKNEG